jgi:hypothetical protein
VNYEIPTLVFCALCCNWSYPSVLCVSFRSVLITPMDTSEISALRLFSNSFNCFHLFFPPGVRFGFPLAMAGLHRCTGLFVCISGSFSPSISLRVDITNPIVFQKYLSVVRLALRSFLQFGSLGRCVFGMSSTMIWTLNVIVHSISMWVKRQDTLVSMACNNQPPCGPPTTKYD